jgi:hypothetical protein
MRIPTSAWAEDCLLKSASDPQLCRTEPSAQAIDAIRLVRLRLRDMTQGLKHGNVTVRSDSKVEVKLGSASVIVEQSELHNLIEALSELRTLVARDRALMNVASA